MAVVALVLLMLAGLWDCPEPVVAEQRRITHLRHLGLQILVVEVEAQAEETQVRVQSLVATAAAAL